MKLGGSHPAAAQLGIRQRLRRRLMPMKLRNTFFEDLVLGAESWLTRGTCDFFMVVEVETTTACNRRCSYCPNAPFERGLLRNEQRMSERLFERLVEQLADLNFSGRLSPHFYGEPLLDERLEQWVALVRRKLPLVKVVIFSNGDYLDLPRYHSLVAAGVDGFLITQHSEKELKGVTRIQEQRRRVGSQGVLFEFRKFDAGTELSNRGGLVDHDTVETKVDCRMPSENVTIDHAGNVILCCNDYFGSVKFGNIAERHLRDIWREPEYVRIRRELKRGRFELELCQRCAQGKRGLATAEKRSLPLLARRGTP